mgnify:CR=1 FL=1
MTDDARYDRGDISSRIKILFDRYPFSIEILAGLISSVLLLISTSKYGIGYENDSIGYVEISKNIWKGIGFYFNNGDPYVMYAPLYSMILSLSNIFGIDTLLFARIINIIIYGFLIGLMARWFRKLGNNGWLLLIGIMVILGSRPLFVMASMAWTELIFIFFTFLFIIYFGKYLAASNSNYKYFSLATASVMFACLMRYVGITLIISGCLLILFGIEGFQRKIKDAFLFGLLSSLPTGFFVLRNYWLTETLVGERYPTNRSIIEVTNTLFKSISNLFIPDVGFGSLLKFISIPIIITIVILSLYIIKNTDKDKNNYWYTIIAVSFSLIYIFYIYISANVVGFDSLTTRFLAPVYLPLIIPILIFISEFWNDPNKSSTKNAKFIIVLRKKRRSFLGFFTIISMLMFLSILYHVHHDFNNSPGIWADPDIRNSETLHFTLNNRPDGKLYSNHPNIFFRTELEGKVHLGPRETYQATDESPNDLSDFNRTIELRESVVYIWFDIKHNYVYSIQDLIKIYDYNVIESFDDGVIYRFYLKE